MEYPVFSGNNGEKVRVAEGLKKNYNEWGVCLGEKTNVSGSGIGERSATWVRRKSELYI